MTDLETLEKIEGYIEVLLKERDASLAKLNKRAQEMYPDMKATQGRLGLPDSYYSNIAIYAWGSRGGKIALLYLLGNIDKLKKEILDGKVEK